MESILTSIKKLLGIAEDYKHFDSDIIMHINTVFLTLNQIGVGPEEVPHISSALDTWNNIFGDVEKLGAIKTYVYLKVRMLFDPPSSPSVLESMNRQAQEIEWRLNIEAENNKQKEV